MRFADDTKRHVVIGRTGSGKTVAGLWFLSGRSFDKMPWIIFDTKGDELIARMEDELDVPVIDIRSRPPKKPGLYIVRPIPEADDGAFNAFLTAIWTRGSTGLYFDEGYMVPDAAPIRAILTQGRSKRIPVIMNSQRPVWLSRFVFSESEFFSIFDLTDERDYPSVQAFVRTKLDIDNPPPDFHSLYYDVGKREGIMLSPVPDGDSTLEIFRTRLAPKRTYL